MYFSAYWGPLTVLDLYTFGITRKLRFLWIHWVQLYPCVMMLEPTVAFSLGLNQFLKPWHDCIKLTPVTSRIITATWNFTHKLETQGFQRVPTDFYATSPVNLHELFFDLLFLGMSDLLFISWIVMIDMMLVNKSCRHFSVTTFCFLSTLKAAQRQNEIWQHTLRN